MSPRIVVAGLVLAGIGMRTEVAAGAPSLAPQESRIEHPSHPDRLHSSIPSGTFRHEDLARAFLREHPEYMEAAIFGRLTEPDRVVSFRVVWQDDEGIHLDHEEHGDRTVTTVDALLWATGRVPNGDQLRLARAGDHRGAITQQL